MIHSTKRDQYWSFWCQGNKYPLNVLRVCVSLMLSLFYLTLDLAYCYCYHAYLYNIIVYFLKSDPHKSVSQEWNWDFFLYMIIWFQMMHMGHTNHMAQSVSHWDPCSAVCGCCSEVMQLFQNLNFFKTRYSNGCSFFNVKARIMKLWQLKVLKSVQNHSFMWFFDLLSEKSSNLVRHLGGSRAGKSHISAMWTQIWLWNLDMVKKHEKMLFERLFLWDTFLIYSLYSLVDTVYLPKKIFFMTAEAVLRTSGNKGRHGWPFRVFR